ncbi:hypothetical protein [Hyphomicrobium sp.]|uniref:hypothetical protein n=1 Tax=Hyphomicrobium sp. TaxID=82 RepID=UPI0025BB7A8C|nr:hypothetical protein [Hyphomicrobium sp.]
MRRTDLDNSPERKMAGAVTLAAAGVVVAISVIAVIFVFGFGGSAAAGDETSAKVEEIAPVSLAGRWTGHYYGYGRNGDAQDCGEDGCALTYDIVACKDGWCGIAIKDDNSCGDVAVHLASDASQGEAAFKGKLELAKGAAPYAIEAWYRTDEESKIGQLHLLGDTGPELLLFRRSYPFEANFARTGDATCKAEKTTS